MKKIFLGNLVIVSILLYSFSFPAFAKTETTANSGDIKPISTGELKILRNTLETNRNKALNTLIEVKKTIEKEVGEMSKVQDITLFKATVCLGIFDKKEGDLDIEANIKQKRNQILDEYIKFNADIQRLEYGLMEKNSTLENDIKDFSEKKKKELELWEQQQKTKIKGLIEDFLKYVENNQSLLTDLATKMDALYAFEDNINKAEDGLHNFKIQVSKSSTLIPTLEKAEQENVEKFQKELDEKFMEIMAKNPELDTTIRTKILDEKRKINQKFKEKNTILTYYLFSKIFSYEDYLVLSEKAKYLNENYYTASGAIDCQKLLTSKKDLNLTLQGTEALATKFSKGISALTKKLEEKNISLLAFTEPTLALYQKMVTQEKNKQFQAFESFIQQLLAQSSNNEGKLPESSTTVEWSTPIKTTFTIAFQKGSSHPQIKTLQEYLKQRGYYQGEINGKYDAATISAVYQFQLKEGIFNGNEQNKSAYGRFGPATRTKVNQKING